MTGGGDFASTRVFAMKKANPGTESDSHAPRVYKLYAYNDLSGELKTVNGEIAARWFSCLQSADESQVFVSRSDYEGTDYTLKIFAVADGTEKWSYSPQPNENFANISPDFGIVVLEINAGAGEKIAFIETANGGRTEVDMPADTFGNGFFTSANKTFVFGTGAGDGFIYDFAQRKLSPLPMPLYQHMTWVAQTKYLLLRKQDCPIERCSYIDERATLSFKLMKPEDGTMLDIPNNGKDIFEPVWVGLTAGQHAKWKAAAMNAEFVKSAKPAADTGGPALSVSRFVWRSKSTGFACSRNAGATISWAFGPGISGSVVSDPESSGYYDRGRPLGTVLGLWPVCSLVDLGVTGEDGAQTTIGVSDGTAGAEERVWIYNPPHPPQVSLTTLGDATIENGSSWKCSLAEVTGLVGDPAAGAYAAAAAAYDAAGLAQRVTDNGRGVSRIAERISVNVDPGYTINIGEMDFPVNFVFQAIRTSVGVSSTVAARLVPEADEAAAAAVSTPDAVHITAADAATTAAIAAVREVAADINAAASYARQATEGYPSDEGLAQDAHQIVVLDASTAAMAATAGTFSPPADSLPGCAVLIEADDEVEETLTAVVAPASLRSGMQWENSGSYAHADGRLDFAVQRPAAGQTLPMPMGTRTITVSDESGYSTSVSLNLELTY